MTNRPSPALIAVCLRDAQPTIRDAQEQGSAAVDARRAKAVRTLHALWRRWRTEARAVETAVREAWAAQQRQNASKPAYVIRKRWRTEVLSWAAAVAVAEDVLYLTAPEPGEAAAIEAALQQRRADWIALGAPLDFDRALCVFFERAGRVIFANPDPSAAMRIFWEGKPRRGRRAEDNAERNFELAAAVQERVDAGETIEDASHAVGEAARPCLSEEAVRKVYYRLRVKVRAERAFRALWYAGDNDPSGAGR